MKILTSVTMHNTSEGQRLSYTYSVVDEATGAVLQDNIRESMIVLAVPANKDLLKNIEAVKAAVSEKLEG